MGLVKKKAILIFLYLLLVFMLTGCIRIPVPSKAPLSAIFFFLSNPQHYLYIIFPGLDVFPFLAA